MNDWAKELGDEVKKKQQQKATDDAKFLEIQRLIKQFGPTLWDGLVTEVTNSCHVINERAGEDIAVIVPASEYELKVRNEHIPQHRLSAHFNVDKGQIAWEVAPLANGGSALGHYEVGIDPRDGTAKLYPLGRSGEKLVAPSPSNFFDIAKEMLTVLCRN